MLFNVISNDKIKILIESNETYKFIELEKEVVNKKPGDCIAKLLIEVYKNTGINFVGRELYIETIRGVDLSFYVIITRVLPNISECEEAQNNEVDMYIFELEWIEQIFEVYDLLGKYPQLNCCKSDLYEYNKNKYLCIYFNDTSDSLSYDSLIFELKNLLKYCRWGLFRESIIREWGRLICADIFKKIKETL